MFKRKMAIIGALVHVLVSQSQAADLRDFPAQTHWVLSLDVKALRNSPLMASIADKIDPDKHQRVEKQLAAAQAMFGIDLLKDIDRLVIAGNGNAEKGGVAYVYGSFNVQQLSSLLSDTKHCVSSNHNGVTVLSWTEREGRNQKHLSFAKPGLAILSNTQNNLADALDVISGKKPGLGAGSPLGNAFPSMPHELLTLYAYGLPSIVGMTPKAESLKQAEALRLRIRAPSAESVEAELSVTATNEAIAMQIQRAFLGIQAIALLRAADAPEPAALAAQAKVTCKDRTVEVALGISRTMVENVIRAREARRASKAQPATAAPQHGNAL